LAQSAITRHTPQLDAQQIAAANDGSAHIVTAFAGSGRFPVLVYAPFFTPDEGDAVYVPAGQQQRRRDRS
jgi:hypothetical protein